LTNDAQKRTAHLRYSGFSNPQPHLWLQKVQFRSVKVVVKSPPIANLQDFAGTVTNSEPSRLNKKCVFMKKIDKLKKNKILVFLYWCSRIGMGLTFIISGTRKLPKVKFTTLPIDNPVGFYFEAMYATGFYWNFIGYFQILIGILIFFNRFVVISSLLMMPVVINIFLVSIALNMSGTPIITSAMLLGNLLLLVWHIKNYKTLFIKPIS
jgi:uncharacterized membrane protein YphA (DoxX/SURF4 family)